MGRSAQFSLFVSTMFAILALGLAAGLLRTFARDWDFLLERTGRGFRRRRGLFTRTDVVMPVHRVPA
jgi:putative membrane protein